MEIIESFNDGLFEIYLETDVEYGSWYKNIIVKCNRVREEDSKTWEFCIYDNLNCYNMISKFVRDMDIEIDSMKYADGIEGIYKWLDSLMEEDKFVEHYHRKGY